MPDNRWTQQPVNGFYGECQAICDIRQETKKLCLTKLLLFLGKPEYKYAALIPIKKSDEWWLLTQDERRKIFEDPSHHINFSSKYLSVVARKLYHSRDIGEDFDFLTWFEFAPEHSNQFDELVNHLRNTEEWKYVTREIDIRLIKSKTRSTAI